MLYILRPGNQFFAVKQRYMLTANANYQLVDILDSVYCQRSRDTDLEVSGS